DTVGSKGLVVVEMGSDEEAQAAISGVNGTEHDGRTLTVNEARPRENRGGGGGGGGGRRGYGGGRWGGGRGRGGRWTRRLRRWRWRRWRRRWPRRPLLGCSPTMSCASFNLKRIMHCRAS